MQLNVECTIEHRGNPLSKGKIDMHRLEILSSQAFDRITSSAVFTRLFNWAEPLWDKKLNLDFVSF